ncbi:MAG: hypothetical protein ACRDI2_09880 [Chloroflexota bacterium]
MDTSPGSPFDLRPRREPTQLQFDWVFPYAPVPAGRPLPTLRTLVELPGIGHRDLALTLDTGADLSLIDGGWATLTGFDPTRGARRLEPVRGVGGAAVAYVHILSCAIGPSDAPLRLPLEIGFTDPNAPPPPLNVLGRQSFLNSFAVALENYLLPPRLYLAIRGRHARR